MALYLSLLFKLFAQLPNVRLEVVVSATSVLIDQSCADPRGIRRDHSCAQVRLSLMVEVCAHPAKFSSQEEKSTEHAYCHDPLDNVPFLTTYLGWVGLELEIPMTGGGFGLRSAVYVRKPQTCTVDPYGRLECMAADPFSIAGSPRAVRGVQTGQGKARQAVQRHFSKVQFRPESSKHAWMQQSN